LAIPLLMAGQAQGAILVAARGAGQFEDEDIDILRLIADQAAASIQNARLFEQSSANLAEIEALNRRLTRQAWEEFVGTGGAIRHTLDPDENYPDALAVIGARDEVRAETYDDEHGRSVLAVPLVLRGQAVGTIAVTRPAGEHWSRDEEALLESIAARMAVIAEGIRLVDESSRRAVREQRVNEVSATLLQRATDVESVLRTALNELGGALGSDRISLRIGPAPVDGERKSGSAAGDPDNGRGPSADGGVSNV
jgi:GAF domain-containing protein